MFTLITLLTGCGLLANDQARISLRCQRNYALELYDVNSSIEVYTKNSFVTSINRKNVYSAKWEDVDVDKMFLDLEKDKQNMQQEDLNFTYDISKIGIDLTSNLIMEFNLKNLDKLRNSELENIIYDGNVKETDYKEHLQKSGYRCVDA